MVSEPGFESGQASSFTGSYLEDGCSIRKPNTANINVYGTNGTNVPDVPENQPYNQPNRKPNIIQTFRKTHIP